MRVAPRGAGQLPRPPPPLRLALLLALLAALGALPGAPALDPQQGNATAARPARSGGTAAPGGAAGGGEPGSPLAARPAPSLPPPPPPLSPAPSPAPSPSPAPQREGAEEEEEEEGEEGNELSAWTAAQAANASWVRPTLPPPPPPDAAGPTGPESGRSPAGSYSPAPGTAWPTPPAPSPLPASPSPPATSPLPTAVPPSPAEEEGEEEEDSIGHSGTDVFCNCSSAGSVGHSDCNITTGQCECRPGYVGLQCERCEEGFSWEPRSGRCLACSCHAENAVSPSCDASGRCECKAGATGLKCGECREGYSKFNGTSCELCQCGNHSARCDRLTGVCQDCQGNTEGPRCERCKEQFYRNSSLECLLCPCSTVTSTGTCHIEPGQRTPTCDKCRPGYTGALCSQCDSGYYHVDSICVQCQCGGNVDPAQSPQVCEPDTGECLRCLYHTAGRHCEACQEGFSRPLGGGNCTRKDLGPGPASRGLIPPTPNISTSAPTVAANGSSAQTTVQTLLPAGPSDNSTSALADVSWTQFNIIILTVIIILVVLLMGFVGAVYTYREYQSRKLNAPFWTIELKEDNISFSSYHNSIPNADVSGLLEDDGTEVAPNGQLSLATPMHNYKA